jgi:hypothetical protein
MSALASILEEIVAKASANSCAYTYCRCFREKTLWMAYVSYGKCISEYPGYLSNKIICAIASSAESRTPPSAPFCPKLLSAERYFSRSSEHVIPTNNATPSEVRPSIFEKRVIWFIAHFAKPIRAASYPGFLTPLGKLESVGRKSGSAFRHDLRFATACGDSRSAWAQDGVRHRKLAE